MKVLWKIIVRHPFLLVSLVLLALLILQRECTHQPPCPGSDTVTLVSTTTDTLIITHNHYLPPPQPDTVIHYDTIFPDTAAILADYAALRIYNRTLLNDSTAKISLTDSVQFNAIRGSQLSTQLFQQHTTETITHTIIQAAPPKNKLFVGFTIGASYPLKPIFAPQVSLLTEKDHLYSVAYDPFNKVALASMHWKLTFPSW